MTKPPEPEPPPTEAPIQALVEQIRTWKFWRHMARLQFGLFLFGLAVALMLEARIGLDPWSALHEALSVRSGLSFGRVSQIVGVLLITFSGLVLSVRPGVATLLNMLLIGPWVDVLREQVWFPTQSGYGPGTLQFVCGILVMGLGTAVYIGCRLGAGPRDGLSMGLARRIKRSLRLTRNIIEVTVLTSAFFLGGSIGPGTVIFALLMGPTMEASLRLFGVSHDPSPSFGRSQGGVQGRAWKIRMASIRFLGDLTGPSNVATHRCGPDGP